MERFPNTAHNERGQVLPLFALLLVVLILFIGLAIDFGFAYVTRANLSKAVDAAALAGIRSVSAQGETNAKEIALNAFNMNYGSSGRDTNGTPVPELNFANDETGAKFLDVKATATINTFFIRILPQWTTLKVGAHAQAKRSPLVISMVLDKSGSLTINGGDSRLPPAVSDFISKFDDNIDRASMVSFATGHVVDVAVKRPFINTIQNKIRASKFGGGTFAMGGLQDAAAQNASIADPNVIKVVVFFTDGWANMNQDQLDCTNQQLIYGGCSPSEFKKGWCKNWKADTVVYYKASDAANNLDPQNQFTCGSTQFTKKNGKKANLNMTDISDESNYRAEQMADTLRSQGTAVYAIGLGDTADVISKPFLDNLANIPGAATFNPNQPQGAVVIVPTADDLDAAFQKIANQILFRLTQ